MMSWPWGRLACFSRCGRWVATCGYKDARVSVWATEGARAGEAVASLQGHRRGVTALAFATREEGLLAAGDEGGRVCVWRLPQGLDQRGGRLADDVSVMYTMANLPW
jgi:WD40 repeat protein